MDLSQWPIFSLLEAEFRKRVHWACVFGSAGNEAIIVLRENEVHALGSNSSCCLGLGDSSNGLLPRRIDQLCGKGVVHIAFGCGPHVLALTQNGEIFSWGHNAYGQLGLGVCTPCNSSPTMIDHSLMQRQVTEVACGGFHCLALLNKGEIYAWGFNSCGQIGCGDTVSRSYPTKVTGFVEEKTCVHICCSNASSYTWTTNGEVYGWGQNGSGQLGIGSTLNQSSPQKVTFEPDDVIKQVIAGHSHVLALSDNGRLFSWGSNTYGQLGTGTRKCMTLPTLIATDIGRFAEVAACHLSHLTVAVLNDGRIFMCGLCRSQNILSLMETRFTSIADVFACFSTPPCSWKPLMLACGDKIYENVSKCIETKFNDPDTSDFVIVVEGRSVYVHKAILRMRCSYFHSMLQEGRWKEGQSSAIEIKDYSFEIYYAFLKYLYTDRIELPLKGVIGLLELAESYCECDLKGQCEQLLCRQVCVENTVSLYAASLRYRAQILEEHCVQFALSHSSAIVLSDEFKQLEDSTAKNMIIQLAEKGAFKT